MPGNRIDQSEEERRGKKPRNLGLSGIKVVEL